jgi:uncharacterized protein YjbJ (UPF0337 family)
MNSRTAATKSAARKIAHRTEVLKGTAMQTIGRVTGSRRLRARGRRVRATGNARLFLLKIKDALKR